MLLLIGTGGKKSCAIILGADKKHADFSNKGCTRCHEGLKFAARPNSRKGVIRHAVVLTLASLACAVSWGKSGKLQLIAAKTQLL